MSLEPLTGRTYGPLQFRLSPAKTAEFVEATGDDPDRWVGCAPPSYAGALLFSIAPALIGDPDVGQHTRVLVHTDQSFRWHGPLTHDEEVRVTGTVVRVRERAGLNFVTFDVTVVSPSGGAVLDATSTFLMGSAAAAEPAEDDGEPPVAFGSRMDPVSVAHGAAAGQLVGPLVRSASRLDLVRYAAASGDFNPIHFDHDAARAAGLDGIVVHGLLMASWLCQSAAALSSLDAPLIEMKLRFRNALRPASEAEISGVVEAEEDGAFHISQRIARATVDLVTAKTVVRRGEPL